MLVGVHRTREREREVECACVCVCVCEEETRNKHSSNHGAHTRLQRNVATGTGPWIQRFRRKAFTIQHNETHYLGALPPGSSDEGSCILNLHTSLAATTPSCCSDEADE